MRIKHAFLLGAAKAGSTSVASMLSSHPQVLLSSPKEPLFFEWDYRSDISQYERTLFPSLHNETIALNARPLNLYLPFVPSRIAESFPESRLVVVLRNPTDRAFSHWTHRWQRWRDRIPVGTFNEEVALDLQRLEKGKTFSGADGPQLWREELVLGGGRVRHKTPLLLPVGHYAEQLLRYFSLFDSAQMHVMFLDEISKPASIRHLLDFLGICDIPLCLRRTNPTRVTHNAGLAGKMTAAAQKTKISRLLPARLNATLRDALTDTSSFRLAPPARVRLDEHFAPYNAQLEELLGRRLPPDWPR